MRNLIVALFAWLLGVLAPGTGKRRADARPTGDTPEASRSTTLQLPAHRSPYGRHVPLDGEAAALVRPYVLAVERERAHERALQRRRRIALVLAMDCGIDLDRHVIGAEGLV